MEPPQLAPSPEFRYVGFEPGPSVQTRVAASLFTAGASAVAGWIGELGFKESLVGALLVSAGFAYALRTFGGPTRRLGVRSARLAIVPWGILVEDDAEPRVLRWAAIRRVHLHSVYGNDAGTPSTLWSFIVVETQRERFASRTGHLDEVAPFLFDEDVAALKAWVLASPVAEAQSRARAAHAESPARANVRAS